MTIPPGFLLFILFIYSLGEQNLFDLSFDSTVSQFQFVAYGFGLLPTIFALVGMCVLSCWVGTNCCENKLKNKISFGWGSRMSPRGPMHGDLSQAGEAGSGSADRLADRWAQRTPTPTDRELQRQPPPPTPPFIVAAAEASAGKASGGVSWSNS